MTSKGLSSSDEDILRRLAERKARIAGSSVNGERRAAWLAHNALEKARPMILAEIGGVMDETLPESSLECRAEWARRWERGLRAELYEHEVLKDDHVVEPWIACNWNVTTTPYIDVSETRVHVPKRDDGKLGARRWDPPLKDLSRDFKKLRPRAFSVDREATLREKDRLESVFAGVLPVSIRGNFWWTFGMTWTAIDLIGLENLMLFMYDDPEGLHRLMRYLCDDHARFSDWLEREGLLTLNNGSDYIGSGSRGHTRELPVDGFAPGGASAPHGPARMRDLWVLLESQETVGVSPDQFERFVFPYQRELASRFGLVYYGCCEPVHGRWNVLKGIPNLRSVSVSPWADEELMAEALAGRYVYSRKPSPAQISTPECNWDAVRADIHTTFTVARDCDIEIVMKDVHTLAGHPERLAGWVRVAREESDKMAG